MEPCTIVVILGSGWDFIFKSSLSPAWHMCQSEKVYCQCQDHLQQFYRAPASRSPDSKFNLKFLTQSVLFKNLPHNVPPEAIAAIVVEALVDVVLIWPTEKSDRFWCSTTTAAANLPVGCDSSLPALKETLKTQNGIASMRNAGKNKKIMQTCFFWQYFSEKNGVLAAQALVAVFAVLNSSSFAGLADLILALKRAKKAQKRPTIHFCLFFYLYWGDLTNYFC